jgi:ABC-type sugar transport system ATPase subunit
MADTIAPTSNPRAVAPTTPRVAMTDICQSFSTTQVLFDVALTVLPGEIRALVGQNGAGKSTLMKILGGLYPEHSGSIAVDGEPVHPQSPRDALRHGIGMIYQELSLIPSLTVAENILLGQEPGRLGYSRSRTLAAAGEITAGVPMLAELPLGELAGDLSTGLQQRVEIAKALSRDARVLVMDEPTARLSGPEREDLRLLMVELASRGIAVIYISHYLEEIFAACHTVTVMRNGRVVDAGPVGAFTVGSLTRAMLGEDLAAEEFDPANAVDRIIDGDPVLQLDAVSGPRIHDITAVVRAGEIVGLAGLVGSGRTRLARTIVGAEPLLSGSLTVRGRDARLRSPREALAHGIVLIPENRKTEGIVGITSARQNMLSMALDRGFSRFGFIKRRAAAKAVDAEFSSLEIRPNTPALAGERFSGGNQQKILMGRAFLARPQLLIADQPTAGVDVGTKAQIHRLLKNAATRGAGVLVVSDDLDELLAVCDRILVMRGGRMVSEHRRSALDRPGLVEAIASD